MRFQPKNSTEVTLHLESTRCTKILSTKAIGVTSKEPKKINRTQHMPTIQLGKKRRVTCYIALHHALMITCLAISKRPKRWRRRKGTSRGFSRPTLELNGIQQRDVSITSYTLNIKELSDALGSIIVDEMVQIRPNGIAPWFKTIRSVVLSKDNPPSFFDLQSMLLIEENHVRTRSNVQEGHMLYSNSDEWRGQGCGRRGRLGQGKHNQEKPREPNSTIGKTFQTHEAKCLEEGGVILLDPANETTSSGPNTVANSTTTRRSVRKRKVSRPSPTDNLLIAPQILITTIVAECSWCRIQWIRWQHHAWQPPPTQNMYGLSTHVHPIT